MTYFQYKISTSRCVHPASILSFAFIFFFLVLLAASLAGAETIELELRQTPPQVLKDGPYGVFQPNDWLHAAPAGAPDIPYSRHLVLLPPDADLASLRLEILNQEWEPLPGKWQIHPVLPPVSWTDDGPALGSNDPADAPEQILLAGSKGIWKLAEILLPLFRYDPISGLLESSTGVRVSLDYTARSRREAEPMPSSVRNRQYASAAVNFSEIFPAYAREGRSAVRSQTNSGYLILTTQAIQTASTKLADFVQHKSSEGHNAQVITEDVWGGGLGDTAAENLRAWLIANAAAYDAEYLLLIGNPDPADGDVPMKLLTPRPLETEYKESPSDSYYSDLTGDWDINGNGLYGEKGSNYMFPFDFATGGVDRNYELAVGRIPYYGSAAELDAILTRLIAYGQQTRSETSSRKKVLLPMDPLDTSTPGWRLGQAIYNDLTQGFAAHRLYDPDDDPQYPAPETSPCDEDNTSSAWNALKPGYVAWFCHGSATAAQDVLDLAHLSSLPVDAPAMVFAGACYNGHPETSSNLAYSLLVQGAAGVVASSRMSWYYPGRTVFANHPSLAGLVYEFTNRILTENLPAGHALYEMKQDLNPSAPDYWMNFTNFNLYGDPSLVLIPASTLPLNAIQLLLDN